MISQRVDDLRRTMGEVGIDAYIVPSSDAHQNEYVPKCWRRREWISGFTGSAGTVVVTVDFAGLWTDGRYHLQAKEQLDESVYTLFPVGIPNVKEVKDWLGETLLKGQAVGVDPKLISRQAARTLMETLESKGSSLVFLEENLVDHLWEDHPPMPDDPVHILPERFSGESVASKLARLREEISRFEVDAHVVSALDAIAWLFNLRGTDVPFNPVFIAYALIDSNEATLFIDPRKVPGEVTSALEGQASFLPYNAFGEALDACAARERKVWIDPKRTSQWIYEKILYGGVPFQKQSPLVRFKALKNPVEKEGMRTCHVRDGTALVRFLRWLDEAVPEGGVTEVSAANKLEKLRRELEHFQGPSFETIVGYEGHGAIIHYAPSEDTDQELRPQGLLLVDSGGHYLDGTTDVTRTSALGPPSPELMERFTRVLKGHIQLARARFPKGTSGKQLEVLARNPLWELGLDYRHGTGHGVGAYLNVHEGPQSFSPKDPGVALEPGMVLSNEPGYYEGGAYGIRIESVMIVEEDESVDSEYGPFYRFEVLTMAPIDRRLIDPSLLTPEERDWLNMYHARVYERLSPLLDEPDRGWLEEATKPL